MPQYIRHDEGTFASLTKQQKEAVGLLSIGTFLEYFDLMLYVHMAVLLNELFFPKFDPFTNQILMAFTFCSTYLLRPFSALIFGWIGDNIGRKPTVVITTFIMSISCVTMATLPTYEEIGIISSIIMIICRMLQGISSLGEIVGARLYLTELIKPPIQYVSVGLISICTLTGGLVALGIAWLCTSLLVNWRYAFWLGALIAVIGTLARTRLREVPEFVDAKRRVKKALDNLNQSQNLLKQSYIYQEKVNFKTSTAYFFILSMWPAIFFLVYIYCGNILKFNFGYTGTQVIQNNFYVTLFNLLIILFLSLLSKIIDPFKILKIRIVLFLIFFPILIYILSNITHSYQLFLLQLAFIATSACEDPAIPILYKCFPIFKRFTYSSFIHAIAKLLIYIITSFGIVILIQYFGYWGLCIIMMPLALLFYKSLNYLEKIRCNK